jgi:hypothetical protein
VLLFAASSSTKEGFDVPKAEASGASEAGSYGTSDASEAGSYGASDASEVGSSGVFAKARLEDEASVAEHLCLPRKNFSPPGSRSRS